MSRRLLVTSLFALIAVLAVPSGTGASAQLTASGVRIADHPPYVRAVVDFTGGALVSREVEATDPSPFDGSATLRLSHAGARTHAAASNAHGLRVHVVQGPNRLKVVLTSARGRFKYLSYAVVGGNRLAIDLWKSAPPARSAELRQGAGGCLRLDSVSVRIDGRVTASGREKGLFEHHLLVVVRGTDGRVLAQQALHSSGGRWNAMVFVNSSRDQAGTLEAVAASPKDGTLACLVQRRVMLPFTAPAVQPMFYRAHADVDGDGRLDLITLRTASQPGGALIQVTLASGRVLSVRTGTMAAALPALVTVGNVDGRPGDELFVDAEHISTNDSISVYTYAGGQLRLAGGAPVSAHPGLFAGITCTARGSQQVLSAHQFALQPLTGPRYWTRQDTEYVWQGSALRRQAPGAVARIAGTPPPGLVGVHCGYTPTR